MKPAPKKADSPAAPGRRSQVLARYLPSVLILAVTGALFLFLLLTAKNGRVYGANVLESDAVSVQRAEVLNISEDTVEPDEYTPDLVEKGNQRLLVRLTTGTLAGQVRELDLMVGYFSGPKVRVGDRIMVLQSLDEEAGELRELIFFQYDRISQVWIVLGLFLLAVLAVGGRTGLKSLLGLGVTVVTLIWIFCPLWMRGADPLWLALGLCALVTVMSFVLLGGTTKKTLCAILATLAGVALSGLFGELAQALCRVTSYNLYDVDGAVADLVNLQTRAYPVHVHGILSAGIIIASLGAVMDVAMSLSSAIGELKAVNPGLRRLELWRSAMNIGRDMVGTMTNTLILAFVGTSLVTVLRIWTQGPSYRALLSSGFLSVELISALSSSIGVILAVPLTALIGSLFYGRESKS